MNWGKIMGCVGDFIGRGKQDMGYSFGWDAAQQASQATQNKITQLQLAQQQAQMQNAAAQQAAFGGYAAQATQTQVVRTLAAFNLQGDYTPTFEELNDEGSIYNMPIQTAIDLAINKFGSGWFKDEATQDALDENTKFWLEIMSKLFKAGHLVCERCHQVDKDEIIVAWKIKDTDHGNR